MNQSIVAFPMWLTVASLFGATLVALVVIALSQMSREARNRALLWWCGISAFTFLTLGFTQVGLTPAPMVRAAKVQTTVPRLEPSIDAVEVMPIVETTYADIRSQTGAYGKFWGALYESRVKLAAVVAIGLIALMISAKKAARQTAPASKPAELRTGLGWLVIPAACLAVLGYLAFPTLLPTANPGISMPPAMSSTVQQRMDKIVRDLVEKSSGPDAQIKGVPAWITDKARPANRILLSSQQYGNQADAEAELLPLATELLQRAFHEHHPWQGAWNVPVAQFRERAVKEEYLQRGSVSTAKGPLETFGVHWLVDVSPEVTDGFTAAWKTQIVERRLKVFGVLLAWFSGVLLMGKAYFASLTLPNQAHYWAGTLKASVLTIVLTALAGWVLVEYIR